MRKQLNDLRCVVHVYLCLISFIQKYGFIAQLFPFWVVERQPHVTSLMLLELY